MVPGMMWSAPNAQGFFRRTPKPNPRLGSPCIPRTLLDVDHVWIEGICITKGQISGVFSENRVSCPLPIWNMLKVYCKGNKIMPSGGEGGSGGEREELVG